ncbi:MAG TPA: hypothetical protein VK760_13375 [Candidatus Acidoferrales bacterium]|jgi:hypothetical protein|nr:hypothetical protein [Candidatus Acidoferrales bacterium]
MSDSEALPDRRSFLVRSAATLAAGTLLTAEACSAPVEDPVALRADFVALSSALIGVAAAKLAPENGAGGVAGEIFAIARKTDERAFAAMLQAYRAHASEPPQTAAGAVLDDSGTDVRFLAQSVMLAWLLGSWYEPAALQRAAQAAPGFIPSSVISASAYRDAWAWKIAQTKAMGTTTAGFGHWASAPPPLDDFIGRSR